VALLALLALLAVMAKPAVTVPKDAMDAMDPLVPPDAMDMTVVKVIAGAPVRVRTFPCRHGTPADSVQLVLKGRLAEMGARAEMGVTGMSTHPISFPGTASYGGRSCPCTYLKIVKCREHSLHMKSDRLIHHEQRPARPTRTTRPRRSSRSLSAMLTSMPSTLRLSLPSSLCPLL